MMDIEKLQNHIIPSTVSSEVNILDVDTIDELIFAYGDKVKRIIDLVDGYWLDNSYAVNGTAYAYIRHNGENLKTSASSIYGLRPLLNIKDFDFKDIEVGDIVLYRYYSFRYIGLGKILFDNEISVCPYNQDNNTYLCAEGWGKLTSWHDLLYKNMAPFTIFLTNSLREYRCLNLKEVIKLANKLISFGSGDLIVVNNVTGLVIGILA